MSDRKVVADFEIEITNNLALIKKSGTMNPNTIAITALCGIYQEVVGDKCCLSCSGHLSKVYKYFLQRAKDF